MAKKVGFALGAGGSRGIAHIGFLKAMEEGGVKADFVTGTSMGSVIGACYSAGFTPDFMHEEICKLKPNDIFNISFNPISGASLLRTEKMRKKLDSYFAQFPTFNQLKIPFQSVAVDLYTGKVKVFAGDELVSEGVTASCSIPGVFKAVEKDDMLLVDGGIKCRVPVNEVREMGADIIIAVDVLGDIMPKVKKYNLFSLMFRMYDIMDAELTNHKIKEYKPDFYLLPELGNMDPYKFKDLEFAYTAGYNVGKANVEKIRKKIGLK